MKVVIRTEYLGGIRYRIAVIVDGKVKETVPAIEDTVAGVRNRLCEYWADRAKKVRAAAIPDASDMVRKRGKRREG